MEWMRNLGGRKFILTVIMAVLGGVVEYYKDGGISVAFAGLLGTLVTAFCASNSYVSKAHFEKGSGGNVTEISDGVDEINNSMKFQADEVQGMKQDMNQLKETTGQLTTTISNLQKLILAVVNK